MTSERKVDGGGQGGQRHLALVESARAFDPGHDVLGAATASLFPDRAGPCDVFDDSCWPEIGHQCATPAR